MGMVASSTLDLMRLPSLDLSEIGKCREIFYMAQRMGRIANVLTTYQREIQEGDVSNEIVHRLSTDRSLNFSECQEEMEIEFDKLFSKICGMKNEIKCFSVESFAKSIRRLLTFHKALIGLI